MLGNMVFRFADETALPGFIPGILSGCFLGLLDFFSVFGPVVSDILRLNFPSFFFFLFFFFLLGSFGGVGSGFGNNSGWASLNRFRAIFCLLLTIFYATIVTYASLKEENDNETSVVSSSKLSWWESSVRLWLEWVLGYEGRRGSSNGPRAVIS